MIHLRLADAQDLPAIDILYTALYENAAQLQPFLYVRGNKGIQTLTALLQEAQNTFLLACDDQLPIGFALIQELSTESCTWMHARHYLQLADCAIIPAYRGRGISHMLLDEIKRMAYKKGINYIELQVLSNNTAAIRLYTRHRFVVNGMMMQLWL